MRALTYHGANDVRVDTVPDPEIKEADDIILRVTATAICGSDLHLYRGKIPTVEHGDIFGHEFMGIVEETGPAVTAVQRGDRVCAFLPNTPHTIVSFLAVASLGAIWSCSSPDFGTHGVIDRFGQIEPKVLITCAGYCYAGKDIDQTTKLNEILEQLPSLQQLIIVPYSRAQARIGDYRTHAEVHLWDDFYEPAGDPDFVPVPFNHPLYVLYSSGTTGVPKCIIHSTGGVLLQGVNYSAKVGTDGTTVSTTITSSSTGSAGGNMAAMRRAQASKPARSTKPTTMCGCVVCSSPSCRWCRNTWRLDMPVTSSQ